MMNAEERTCRIMRKVEKTGASPMSSHLSDLFQPTGRDQIVKDRQGCWLARFTPDYLQLSGADRPQGQPAGYESWGLFQLYVYGALRITAHYHGDRISVKLYKSGAWEDMFFIATLPRIANIVPGT